jgi:lon-related putative ATP-dependent protease
MTEVTMPRELSSDQVRRTCNPDDLAIETTQELSPLEGIIGQKRAVEALRFGLDMPNMGFNVYVAGLPGTGKTTAVRSFLERRAKRQTVPSDWCYVNNFKDAYRPKAVRLPAGQGREFQKDVKDFIDEAQRDIRQVFESEEYRDRREKAQASFEQGRQALFKQVEQRARDAGFLLQVTPMGIAYVPMKDGKPLDQDEFAALTNDDKEDMEKRQRELQEGLSDAFKEIRGLTRKAQERVRQTDREVALYALGHLMDELLAKYGAIEVVSEYLREMREDILENVELFRSQSETQEDQPPKVPWMKEMPFRKYEVNVVVDNSGLEGAPVVSEENPTYNDLFGRIEKEAQMGALHTDFTLIRGGSIHRANGGYLVVPIQDILRNLLVWDSLKRAVRNRMITIEELGERLGFIATRGLQPEPIPLDVKVILIGNPLLYSMLYTLDEDFSELFKVKADFDIRMDRTAENVRDYIAFVCTLCKKEGLRPMDREAAARIVEVGSREAEDQEKLSTHFAMIADLIREANFWAGRDGAERVGAGHVKKAIEQKLYRSNLIQERIQEMIQRGTLLIDTTSEKAGQVNGLAVIALGDYMFGRPNRITASIGMGRSGIVDIEREAKLGGRIHTKGVLILSGYLVNQYAAEKPLSLSARLVFEQTYEGVDGDSASSTELYALLSALSGIPIKQGIAVTGSVNQKGEVQAIGGVNQKIEGFFEVCSAHGLNGRQGVMIPASNVKNLMLKEEVVEAVKKRKFHIWPVGSIDEGIEVLTGVPAGVRGSDGAFPENTVHGRVDKRLSELAERIKSFGKDEASNK